MTTYSAGIALYRVRDGEIQVFLGRFGGPFWRNRERAWGIPKGEYDPDQEPPEDAARREFEEETGFDPPDGLTPLGRFPVGRAKVIDVFTAQGDAEPTALAGGTFELEWPPRSGRLQRFPEIERGAWCTLPEARRRVTKSQVAIIDALADALS